VNIQPVDAPGIESQTASDSRNTSSSDILTQ